MENKWWQPEKMMAGVDPGKFSGPALGHGVEFEILSIGSQVNREKSGSKRGEWGEDIDGNAAANANDERRGKGGSMMTPRRRGRPKGSRNKPKASGLSPRIKSDECHGKGGAVMTPRRRGRPKGSRNNPRASGITPRLHALEIPSGVEVMNTLETFARRGHVGLFVLSGNGMVRNVTLRNPAAPAEVVTFEEPLQIISISGAFPSTTENQEAAGIMVSLVDVQSGVIVAGSVMGNLVAFGRVFVMVGTAVEMHQEPNVEPVQLQPSGLSQSPDPLEAYLLPEYRTGEVVEGI